MASSPSAAGDRFDRLLVQNDLGRVREVVDVHRFHLTCERLVVDEDIEFAVAEPADLLTTFATLQNSLREPRPATPGQVACTATQW